MKLKLDKNCYKHCDNITNKYEKRHPKKQYFDFLSRYSILT